MSKNKNKYKPGGLGQPDIRVKDGKEEEKFPADPQPASAPIGSINHDPALKELAEEVVTFEPEEDASVIAKKESLKYMEIPEGTEIYYGSDVVDLTDGTPGMKLRAGQVFGYMDGKNEKPCTILEDCWFDNTGKAKVRVKFH